MTGKVFGLVKLKLKDWNFESLKRAWNSVKECAGWLYCLLMGVEREVELGAENTHALYKFSTALTNPTSPLPLPGIGRRVEHQLRFRP